MPPDIASATPVMARAEALLLTNQPEQASALLNDMPATGPAKAKVLHLRSLAAASLGRHDEAIGALSKMNH